MVFGREVLTLSIVAEQITIQLDDLEAVITYDEWRKFVEEKRGKWRTAASEEGAKALRAYVDSEQGDDGASDAEKERLEAEIERLKTENERLSAENQRLHEQLAGNAPRGAYSGSSDAQTKNTAAKSTYLESDSNAESERADETDETGVFTWDAYDPDADDVTIPRDAIKALPEQFDTVTDPDRFDGQQIPEINPDHIDDDEIPGRSGDAKTALVAGVLRRRGDVLDEGELVGVTTDVTGNGTPWYVRGAHVMGERDDGPDKAVIDWLAGRHPHGDDGKWVTTVDAYRRLVDEMVARAKTRRGREIEKHVGLAFGAAQYLDSKSHGGLKGPKMDGYKKEWDDALFEPAVTVEDMNVLAAKAVSSALHELYDRAEKARAKSGRWESLWEEWPPGVDEEFEDGELSAEALIRWWDEEYRKGDRLPDGDVETAAETLEKWVPSERRPFRDGDEDEEAVDEKEETEEVEVASDAEAEERDVEEVNELDRVEQAEQESAS